MSALARLLRFWFTFESRVSRRDYLIHGLALAALKYAVDAAVIYAATERFWMPLDYLRSAPFLLSPNLSNPQRYFASWLVLWTLPFLWIGVSMTIRRLLDAGWSAWWALLFFVPLMNYGLMLTLALIPSSPVAPAAHEIPDPHGNRLPSALLSMAIGALTGLAMMFISIKWIQSYGLALFMGAPFCIGVVTAFVLCRRYPATVVETYEVVAMTILIMAGAAFLIGFEGIICLLMAAPLGVALALMGAAIGRYLARRGESYMRGAVLIGVLFPLSALQEAESPEPWLREVRTSVVVDAEPMAVWNEVIAFSPIPEPTALLFRLGLAYPLRAEIVGAGVGAIRYCVFSTGAFVEPITAWEPGKRLSFDVIESPPPLRELTFYNVAPPHLDGYLQPRRGEFRLIALPDGRTRLEGSTWYVQRLRPEGYWVLYSDYIIGAIHRRVLEHIRDAFPRKLGERETGSLF